MWNDRYRFPEDWDRVRDKIRRNQKKLGTVKRPCNEASSHKRGRAKSPDNQGEKRRQSAAEQPSKKTWKKTNDTLAAGYTSSDKEPANKNRCQSHISRRNAEVSGQQRETVRTAVAPLLSSNSSEERSSALNICINTHAPESVQVKSKDVEWVLNAPNSSLAPTPPAPSPTVTEVVRSSAISVQKLRELVWEHVGGDIDKPYVLLHDNANTDVHKGWGRGNEAARGELQSAAPMTNGRVAAHDHDTFAFMFTSDGGGIADADMHSRDGTVVGTQCAACK